MSKLNLPIWVINLERSTDRLLHIKSLMNKFGLEYEIIKAIDGEQLTKQEIKKCYAPLKAFINCNRFLTKPELGCTLSHAKCWKRVLNENLAEVLIFEDDVVFNEDFVALLKTRQHFPSNWEFLNFVTDLSGIPFGKPLHKNFRMVQFDKLHNRACAYMINFKGAKKLLAHNYPITRISDGLTGRDYLTNIVSYGIFPKIGGVLDVESTLWKSDSKIKARKPIWKKILVYLAKKTSSKRIARRLEEELYSRKFLPMYVINLIRDKIGEYKMKQRIKRTKYDRWC